MAGINDDVRRLAVMHTDAMAWQPSPSPTVWRKRLALHGDAEKGQVTSVVRYDPDSRFPAHGHPRGEEILVLDGTFSDEHGDYPAGSYLLNPPGFAHAPRSREGCVLFVKLRQYADGAAGSRRRKVAVDTRAAPFEERAPGVHVLVLYEQAGFPDRMLLVRVAPGARAPGGERPGGEEVFVIRGGFRPDGGDDDGDGGGGDDDDGAGRAGAPQPGDGLYRAGSWIRRPPGRVPGLRTDGGCLLYVKQGHLAAPAT